MSEKKISGYVIHTKQILGKGTYGSVYRGQQDVTKRQVAVKVLEKKQINKDEYLKSALLSQVKILQLLKSQNVVSVLDVMQSNNNYYIIQELCDSDFQKYLEKKRKISEAEAIQFLKQICNGFVALVKEGIVHRDMKPANLLMSKGVIKIGDFGFAKQNLTKRIQNMSTVGTPLYMPLQILKSQPYTSKCDIWAVGFIFYQMMHGKGPWTANTEFELVRNIENKPLIIDKQLSIHTQDFLMHSLQKRQQDRMSWDEVFKHPIFEGYFQQYSQLNKQFENKFKMVMTELRFKINSNNINLTKLIEALNFKNYKEMTFDEFSEFIRHIHPQITKEEIKYFFEQIDDNGDGKIEIEELYTQMRKNHISIVKTSSTEAQLFNSQKKIGRSNTAIESEGLQISGNQPYLAAEVATKAKKCFVKLYNLVKEKKMSLFKAFFAYSSEKKGQLTYEDFKKMLRRLDNNLAEDELEAIFEYIDIDHSKTIEFQELNSYYCKVNGIPESLDLPPEYVKYMKQKSKKG